jgi:hyperosmotically inducible periplasmic protein
MSATSTSLVWESANQKVGTTTKKGPMIKIVCRILLAGIFLFSVALLSAQQQPASPDNTKMNQVDRDATSPTADQQKDDSSDRELTRQIRRALIKDKSLSTYGHNVKIIAQQGMVTLRGPVRSEEEKQEIETKAAQVAGSPDKIHSELQVTPNNSGSKPSPNPSDNQ